MKWDKLPDGRTYLPTGTVLLLESARGWYRITGAPIGFGGSGIIYPAIRVRKGETGWDNEEMNLAVKECYPSVPGKVLERDDTGQILGEDHKIYRFALEQMRREKSVTGTIYNAGFRLVPVWTSSEREQIALDGKIFKKADNYYAVMERIDEKGCSLENLISSEKLTAKDIMSLGCQLLRALKEVHESGFIHGDIQTNNVFVKGFEAGEDLGMVSLLDFGAARELEEDNKTAPITDRALYTTKGFTAPECLTKNDGTLRLSPSADLYSAGCVFLRLLSGRHISRQALELVTNGRYIYARQAVKLRCPDSACDAINRFLDRALKKDPEERYQSAEEMLQDAVKIEQSLAPANIPISTSEYAAFISYCHSDKTKVAAQLLADSIERYTIPAYAGETVGSIWGLGTKKRKLGKVFMDRTELSGGGDMGEQIAHALEGSAYLIVILGGGSERSEWVAREIETFLKTHTRDRILTVLAEGNEKESMPEILRTQEFFTENGKKVQPIESLSADLRADSIKGVKRALKTEKLRLIAPMLGCSFDDLKGRQKEAEAQRVIRSLSIGMAIFAAVALIVGYQSMQINNRNRQLLSIHARELADRSGRYLAEGDREQALSFALEAVRESSDAGDKPIHAEARAALQDALYLYQGLKNPMMIKKATRIMKMGRKAAPDQESFSPDGLKMLTIGAEGSVFVWDLDTGKCIAGPDDKNENELSRGVLFAGFLDDHNLLVIKKDKALRYPIPAPDEMNDQKAETAAPVVIASKEELFFWDQWVTDYKPLKGTFNEDRSRVAFCYLTQHEPKEAKYGLRTISPELIVCDAKTMQVVNQMQIDYNQPGFSDFDTVSESGPIFSPDGKWAALPLTNLSETYEPDKYTAGAVLLADLDGTGNRVITDPDIGFLSCMFTEGSSLFACGYTPAERAMWASQEMALKGAAFCIDPSSGEMKWRTPIENQMQMGDDASGMLVSDEMVFLWGNRQIHVLDSSNGTLLRTMQVKNGITGVCDPNADLNWIIAGDSSGNVMEIQLSDGIAYEYGTSIDCTVDHFWWIVPQKRMIVSNAANGSYVLLETYDHEAMETVHADSSIDAYIASSDSPYMLAMLHPETYTVLDLRNGECKGSYPYRTTTGFYNYWFADPKTIYKLENEEDRRNLQIIDLESDEVLLDKDFVTDTHIFFAGNWCGWQEDTRIHLLNMEGETVIELPEEIAEPVEGMFGEEDRIIISKMQISSDRYVYLYGSLPLEDLELCGLYDLEQCKWLPFPSGINAKLTEYLNRDVHVITENGVAAWIDNEISSVKIYNAGEIEAHTVIPVSSAKDCVIELSPDGSELYCATKNDALRVYDTQTGKLKAQSSEIYTYTFRILSGDYNGAILVDAIEKKDETVSEVLSTSKHHMLWMYEETPEGTLCRTAGVYNGIYNSASERIICIDKANGTISLYDCGEGQLENMINEAETILTE